MGLRRSGAAPWCLATVLLAAPPLVQSALHCSARGGCGYVDVGGSSLHVEPVQEHQERGCVDGEACLLQEEASKPRSSLKVPRRLRDNSTCESMNINPAPYQYGFLLDGVSSPSVFMPIYTTLSLNHTGAFNPVTKALIIMHGLGANANTYFCQAVGAAAAAQAIVGTVVIAPWFGDQPVSGIYWDAKHLSPDATSVWWRSSGWSSGADSETALQADTSLASEPFSSFSVLDKLIKHLLEDASFPNLEEITISGFSAGCQFASRWAFFTNSMDKKVKVVVGDCGSYLYMDEQRPDPECVALKNTGAEHNCSKFFKPKGNQREWNEYKYGLEIRGSTLSAEYSYLTPYLAQTNESDDSLQTLFDAYPSKDVRLLLGTEDVCNCNIMGMENDQRYCFHKGLDCSPSYFGFGNATANLGCCDTYPDTDTDNACSYALAAQTQGSNRLQRGLNWISYLKHFYAGQGHENYEPKVAFFNGGHNATSFMQSASFTEWVFGQKRIEVPV